MKLPTLLALLSLVLLVSGAGVTKSIEADLPGAGEEPTAIQENIDRIQGEIQNLNAKVANLLAALNETNAAPFQRINDLTEAIVAQQTKLSGINSTINGLSDKVDENDASIKNLTGYVNCFTYSGCGPESF